MKQAAVLVREYLLLEWKRVRVLDALVIYEDKNKIYREQFRSIR